MGQKTKAQQLDLFFEPLGQASSRRERSTPPAQRPHRADGPAPAAHRCAEPAVSTFDPALDSERIGRQLAGVRAALRSGGWWTLPELAGFAGGSEAGVSARVRDLRKRRFGAHRIERRRRGDPHAGLWEYRLATRGGR